MTSTEIVLRSGRLELAITPQTGGSIARFDWVDGGKVAILRPSPDGTAGILDKASFPLVPFVNRVRGGRFGFRGRTVTLSPNLPGDPSPLHGQGWLAQWQVESASETAAELRFDHQPGEWPWAYEARQSFHIDGHGLSLALTCHNHSVEPMPCGLGQHPYFNCGPRTRIDTKVDHVWTIDEHVLPVDKVSAAGHFDLSERLICGQDLDHGFGGWNGEVRIDDPDWPFRVTLSSAQAKFFQIYSPESGGFFAAEPVTHANAALNAPEEQWPDLGLRILEPGEEMRLDMRVEVDPR